MGANDNKQPDDATGIVTPIYFKLLPLDRERPKWHVTSNPVAKGR